MNYIPITVPYALDLAKSSFWDVVDGEKRSIFVIFRFHYTMLKKQLEPGPFWGEVIAPYNPKAGVTIEENTTLKSRQKVVNVQKTVYNALVSSEIIASAVSRLSAELAVSKVFKISPEVKSELTGKIKTDFSKGLELSMAVEEEVELTQQLTRSFDGTSNKELFSVKAFKKSSYQIWLGFIDYLFVEYRRSFWGLRKKRRKIPARMGKKAENIISVKLPLGQVKFWDLMSDGLLVDKDKYVQQVDDSTEVSVEPLTASKMPYLELGDVASLYQLAEVAFPIRWIDLDGNLTAEKLKAIELSEVEEDGSAWWFVHGVKAKEEKARR